jgi:fatty-acyl-CoA synthase
VAVVGVPDEIWGEIGVAYVISRRDRPITAEDLAGFCNGRLARYKWPKKVVMCTDFPRTSLGKVRKNLLAGTNP